MGVGNYTLENAKTIYIFDEQIYPELEDGDDGELGYCEMFMEDAINEILSCLPESFKALTIDEWFADGKVIAENGLYRVLLTGWESYTAISIVAKEGDYYDEGNVFSLALHHLESRSRVIFDKLSEGYELHFRTCAWTSGVYEKAA